MSTNFTPSVQTVSITNGGTSEILVAASQERQSLWVQPQTEACLINFGATAGVQATGSLTAGDVPDINETIAVNGVTFTYVASSASATQITRGATVAETADNTATILNASVNASISVATYTSDGVDTVTITYDAGGTDGNAYTLADSSAGSVTRSAATLAGGSNTAGGLYLAQYQIADISTPYGSQRQAVYVTSATTGAKVSYLEGFN